MTLQQQVQQHLQNTGISLRELSRRSGVSHTTIGKILRGGTYKSDTANDLIFAMSFYGGDTARPVMQAETLHDKVEAIAADRVDHDKGAWDVDLNCAKYRRVMQLEAEVFAWKDQHRAAKAQCEELNIVVSDAQDMIEYLKRLAGEDGQKIRERDSTILDLDARMDAAKAEIKRLTALAETHGQSWKAACVQVEQLQKQLDHGQAKYNELWSAHRDWEKDEAVMLEQIDTLFAERDNMRTEYEYSLMRLRVTCSALVCAIVFLIVSGLVVWGGV